MIRRALDWLDWNWPVVILVAVAAPFILYGLGNYSLVNGDERLYHAFALRMVESGDWLRLEWLGEHRIYDTYMNAPLQYWARAIVITLFGSSEWTVRILSALAAVATLPMTYRLTLHLTSDRRAAFLAGVIQLTTFQFIYLHCARTGELEPFVVLLFTAIVYFFLKGLESRGSFIPHHICLVLLFNLKAPVVFIPLLAEAACFVFYPATRSSFRRFVRNGMLILPLGAAWHLANLVAWWESSLEVVSRMFGEARGGKKFGLLEKRSINASFYLSAILFGALPYSFAYPLAFVDNLIADRRRADRLGFRIIATFVIVVFVFFVAVGKRHPWYIMPMYPLLSIFLANSLVRLRSVRPARLALAGIALGAALLVFARVDVADYNPFARTAQGIGMSTEWTTLAGLSTGVVVAALAAAMLAILLLTDRLLVRRDRSFHLGSALAAILSLGLVGIAGYRVVVPLRFIDYRSPKARLREKLDDAEAAAAATGVPLEYPIPIRDTWDARFYLDDRYELVKKGRKLLLYPRSTVPGREPPP